MNIDYFKKQMERLMGFYGKMAKNDETNKQRMNEFYRLFKDTSESLFIEKIDAWIQTEQYFPTPLSLFEKGNLKNKEKILPSCNWESPKYKNKPCKQGLVHCYDSVRKVEQTYLCPNEHCAAKKQYTKNYFNPFPMRQVGLYFWADWQDMEFNALSPEKQERINNFVKRIMNKKNAKDKISAFTKNIGNF